MQKDSIANKCKNPGIYSDGTLTIIDADVTTIGGDIYIKGGTIDGENLIICGDNVYITDTLITDKSKGNPVIHAKGTTSVEVKCKKGQFDLFDQAHKVKSGRDCDPHFYVLPPKFETGPDCDPHFNFKLPTFDIGPKF